MTNDPSAILARLAAIEADLADRQNEFASAAGRRARLVRDVEYAEAAEFARAEGNATERRALAKAAVGATQDYLDLTAAEATYEACKAAINVLSTRATIGQTLLRTLRETA